MVIPEGIFGTKIFYDSPNELFASVITASIVLLEPKWWNKNVFDVRNENLVDQVGIYFKGKVMWAGFIKEDLKYNICLHTLDLTKFQLFHANMRRQRYI